MCPGEGDFHIAEFLDAMTAGIPLSLEWPQPRGSLYTPLGWARFALEGTRRFLTNYYAGSLHS